MDDDLDGISDWDIDVDTLRGLDKVIRDDDVDAITHRWHFGRITLDSRGDRQRLPKGALAALSEATGNSRRELQYRMAFADKFPTGKYVQRVARMSWHEIIGGHLTSRCESAKPDKPAGAKPGKVLDDVTVLRDTDVIKGLKNWDHNVFREDSISTYSYESKLDTIRWLKRYADRLQRAVTQQDRSDTP